MEASAEWEASGRKVDGKRLGKMPIGSCNEKNEAGVELCQVVAVPVTYAMEAASERKVDRKSLGKMPVGSYNKKNEASIMKAGREDLAAGAMGRRLVSKVLREMNKADDKEAKLEALRRRMEDEKEALLRLVKEIDPSQVIDPPQEVIDPPQEVTLPPADILDFFGITVEEWDQESVLPTDIVDLFCIAGEVWDASTATISEQGRKETWEERRKMEEKHDGGGGDDDDDDDDDDNDGSCEYEAFRHDWNAIWSRHYGSFEDTTTIPAMRFTYKPPPTGRIVGPRQTLQVFSAKIAEIRGGLQWPLDVFGFIAIRDCIDHNRNIIFNRARDNCQTLTQKDHHLVLVGPTRAVVCGNMGPVTFEVDLKVKGTTEVEDKGLSFLAAQFLFDNSYESCLINCAYASKLSLSTLEFKLGCIVRSVEATIFMRVTRGSWPDDFCGEFAALTTDSCGENTACADNSASIDHEKIVLLDSRGVKLPAASDGKINLSRRIVSVGINGVLKISVKAWKD